MHQTKTGNDGDSAPRTAPADAPIPETGSDEATASELSQDVVQRLAHVRVLLMQAQAMCKEDIPLACAGLSLLHDAAEAFLNQAAAHHHVEIPKDFMSYWSKFEKILGRPLLYNAQLRRLNGVRVGWKHNFTEPSRREISAALEGVEGFIRDECKPLFGIELEEASLNFFVEPSEARRALEEAESLWGQGEGVQAFIQLEVAMQWIMVAPLGLRRPGENFAAKFFTQPRVDSNHYELDFKRNVVSTLERIETLLVPLALSIDRGDLARFKRLTPAVMLTLGGNPIAQLRANEPPRTKEEFEFCHDLVVVTAIRNRKMFLP